MLRASSDTLRLHLDITPVATGAPPDLPAGEELAALVVAMTTNVADEPVGERAALVAAVGEGPTERAIAVCATFQMMNRLLDGVGAPVRSQLHDLARELGFEPSELPR